MSKLTGVVKIAVGAARVASGVVTGTGHGALGGYMRNCHMMANAVRLGRAGVQGGVKMVKEGIEDCRRS